MICGMPLRFSRFALLAVGLLGSLWSAGGTAALPPAGPPPLRVVVLSDFNGPYGSVTYPAALSRTVQRTVNEWKPDLVLSAGDLIAGQKASLSDARVRAMWAAFDREVGAPLKTAGSPFAFTLGNHDASLARDRREAAAYWQAHVPALTYVDRRAFPFRYSFTFGGGRLFVAVLDASGPQVSPEQRTWLAGQLATPQAQAAGVRLVMGHLPLAGVSAGKNVAGEVIHDPTPLRQIMEQGRVLAYLSGHHAAYYPARLGGLNVLASGGIGGRDYVGVPGTARSTVTVLSVDTAAGHATFQTFDAETGQAVATSALPTRISGLGGPLIRVDGFH
ncbi:metallophosphoesterase family protein [Deinococcus aerophilus]|uniref:Metallophosphoesterase n=1 Tax=Deinococcus aerophilus TaxID=522488 RepID=A0ABQ2GUE2_9DEIO|nr:metallophosphoesterase [Deinococcus aerophilus]GGM12562.1 metallophosphoesterase [Deinococcus aerophilus]